MYIPPFQWALPLLPPTQLPFYLLHFTCVTFYKAFTFLSKSFHALRGRGCTFPRSNGPFPSYLLPSSPSTSFTLHVLLFIKLLHSFQKVSTLCVGGDVHSPVPTGPSPPTNIYKITICQLGCGTTPQKQIFIAPSKKYQLNFCPPLRFFLDETLFYHREIV